MGILNLIRTYVQQYALVVTEPPSTPSTDREIYPRAPVMEAAIDIRCTNRPNFTVADIQIVAEKSFGGFEVVAQAIEKTEELSSDGTIRTTEKPLGIMLRSRTDTREILQMQIGGMTYSHTEPYDRWESFRERARNLWRIYTEDAQPQIINRVGVRYINRLQLGAVIDELEPYLKIYPVTPWALKAPPTGFSLQLRLPREDNIVLVVNLATVQHVETSEIAILLDFDASVDVEVAPDIDLTWNLVERLHVVVGEAFEGSITERVRELIR